MTITPEKEIYVATQKAIEEVGVDEFKNTSMFRDGRKHTFITPEEVANLAAAATPGPWEVDLQENWWVFSGAGEVAEIMPWNGGADEADAAFISAAHDMAALIERQDRMLKLADELASANAKVLRSFDGIPSAVYKALATYRTARETDQ